MIDRVSHRVAPVLQQPLTTARSDGGQERADFAQVLRSQLRTVNDLQLGAEAQAQSLARGEAENLHQVMITATKAQVALDLTVAIRNKVLEAYQEISRMQL